MEALKRCIRAVIGSPKRPDQAPVAAPSVMPEGGGLAESDMSKSQVPDKAGVSGAGSSQLKARGNQLRLKQPRVRFLHRFVHCPLKTPKTGTKLA
jgi:hypothetical protein